MIVSVDESFCIEQDKEKIAIDQRLFEGGIPPLNYSLDKSGNLELRWLAGSSFVLFRTLFIENRNPVRVTADVYENGYRVLTVPTSHPNMLYWLANPE